MDGRYRTGSVLDARHHSVDVVNRIDTTDQVEKTVEVRRITNLKVEAHRGDAVISTGRGIGTNHVDLVVSQHVHHVAQQARPV